MSSIRTRTKRPPIILCEADRDRLRALIRNFAGTRYEDEAENLSGEVERAEIVAADALPSDVITLHSTVRFIDRSTQKERDVTLVLPSEADAVGGRVSVIAPVGAALLGLRSGQSIEWDLPNGKTTELVVCAVAQPLAIAHAAIH